jgi:hypothetical protein
MWPAVTIVAIYISISLFDIWFYLPSIAQPIALIVSLLAAYAISKLGLGKQKWGWRRDYGAKYLITALLVTSFIFAQDQALSRISDAFKIQLQAPLSQARISAWVAPPNYTGDSHINLAKDLRFDGLKDIEQNLSMLEGSIIKFSIEGNIRRPRLYHDHKLLPFPRPHENKYQQAAILKQSGNIELNFGGGQKKTWNINVEPDHPPSINFITPPKQIPNHMLEVSYFGQDDFALEKITFQFRKAGQYVNDGSDDAQVFSTPLPINATSKTIEGYQELDLTPNRWAGTIVLGWLEIEDALGQVSTSEVLQFYLPQKHFANAAAKNIINIRKSLLIELTPKEVLSQRLKLLSENKDEINNDYVVYMALRTAYWRLSLDPTSDISLIASLLWEAALRLEETTADKFASYEQSSR